MTARAGCRLLFAVALPLALTACGQAADESARLAVEYGGCATVNEGPVCLLAGNRQIRLWVYAETDERITLFVAGKVLNAAPQPVQGGWRYILQIPRDATLLQVSARTADRERQWQIALATQSVDGELRAARELATRVGPQAAIERLRSLLAASPAPAAAQAARLRSLLARMLLRVGQADAAVEELRLASALHRDAGALYDSADDATVLVYLLLFQQRDFAAARDVLEDLPADWGEPAEAIYFRHYYAGLLAVQSGDVRTALRVLSDAADIARRLGLERLRVAAEQVLAEQLQRVGRRREAEALLAELEERAPVDLPPCERAQLHNNLAWNRLLALEAGEAAADPLPQLDRAQSLLEADCPQLRDELANVLLDRALAYLHAGQPAAAMDALEQSRLAVPEPPLHLVLWRRDIEARIALAQDRVSEAAGLYAQLSELAAATLSPDAAWRAAVGQALAARAGGDTEAALQQFAHAEMLLGKDSLAVPLHEGRETFVARREWATRAHLGTLLAAGATDAALDLARRARVRTLRDLQRDARVALLAPERRQRWDRLTGDYRERRERLAEQTRDDWRLPADRLAQVRQERAGEERSLRRMLDEAYALLARDVGEHTLPPLQAGELLLLFHPLESGWVGFAATPAGVTVRQLACVEPAANAVTLANCLLTPFAADIELVNRIRFLPFGFLRQLDLHALPWQGAALLDAVPVVYGLDLRRVSSETPVPGSLLLVGDPRGDLPAARREVQMVESLLGGERGWRATTLAGAAAAPANLRKHLAAVDLLHYAGHGYHAGAAGWGSALPLAAGMEFSIGDILALPSVPRWVVLSGCETGRASAQVGAESLGLAHAFLSSGSEVVLAAARPVADRSAAALVARFYAYWSDGTPAATALQRAQLDLRDGGDLDDWSSFRLLEP